MNNIISQQVIQQFQSRLEQHPIHEVIKNIEDLQYFMEQHVYSV
ncbi:MAG: DUF3050 domain-containing protein [Gammaproteobacteria bacterium]|nr:DUF3050 domain-containing protein [Gammaproteobacteria bacterium]